MRGLADEAVQPDDPGAVVLREARRVSRRRFLVGSAITAAVAMVGVGAVVYELGGEAPTPAYAATPQMLSHRPLATSNSSPGELLKEIADRVAAEQASPGAAFEHVKTKSWHLHTAVAQARTASAVVPQQREIWRAADDRGRVITRDLAPEFDSKQARRDWEEWFGPAQAGPREVNDYSAGGFPSSLATKGRPPVDPAALARWLRPTNSDPGGVMSDAAALVAERVLTPAEHAALLTMIAGLPGLKYDGGVTDRAGRDGVAFSVSSRDSGLLTTHTIILDPATGDLLGYEEVLPESAGELQVKIPAVIGYRVYLSADHAPMPR